MTTFFSTRALSAIALGAIMAGSLTACGGADADESGLKEAAIEKLTYENDLYNTYLEAHDTVGAEAAADDFLTSLESKEHLSMICRDETKNFRGMKSSLKKMDDLNREDTLVDLHFSILGAVKDKRTLEDAIADIQEEDPIQNDDKSWSVGGTRFVKERGSWKACHE